MAYLPSSPARGLAALAFATCLALPAAAQMGFPGGTGGSMGGPMRGGPRGGEPMRDMPAEIAAPSPADQLYQVRMRLLVTPEQSPAWERFHAAYLALRAVPPQRGPDDGAVTAQQAMQMRLGAAQNGYARTEELSEALKTLLAKLDEKQLAAANEALPRLLLDAGAGPHGMRGRPLVR
ncbi:hypothetical protein LZ009_02795 [Ramlibacter sp. XY19]|uniref:hypothetical protein n=1 Tax=Ramlibacter paludis TaxID=2908000 RepID=UPI0023D9DDCD|nr:hypothetical protein [Ramlibacter paludis]MCG2591700.1 hypothetical protein [Ramlibacter paludis]